MGKDSYIFDATITRVNLALVMQALRGVEDVSLEEIEADIRALMRAGVVQGKRQAVDLLIKYNLAYFNYAKNSVTSYDGHTSFAQIDWRIKSLTSHGRGLS